MSEEGKKKQSRKYLETAGIQGSGRKEGCSPATSAETWALSEKKISDRTDLDEFLGSSRQTDLDYNQKLVAAHILNGDPLTNQHLQVIVAVLLGENDWQTLTRLLRGFDTKFPLPTKLRGYEPSLLRGRPNGDFNRLRDKQIALDYDELRKTVTADEAYAILAKDSHHRYATSLEIDRIKACVTRGRKFAAKE